MPDVTLGPIKLTHETDAPLNTIIESTHGGSFELHLPISKEDGTQISNAIMGIAYKIGLNQTPIVDITKTSSPRLQALVHDKTVPGDYVAIEDSEYHYNPQFATKEIKILLADGTSLDILARYEFNELDRIYKATNPQVLNIHYSDCYINVEPTGERYTIVAKTPEAIRSAPDIISATSAIISRLGINSVDPFEKLYGELTPSHLIREYYGNGAIVDSEKLEVVVLEGQPDMSGIYKARKVDFSQALTASIKHLRGKLFGPNFTNIPERIRAQRLENIT